MAINDGIPSELASASYASIDDVMQHILQLGKGSRSGQAGFEDLI